MNRLLQRSLVWLLAMALFASGLPLAHAAPCATTHRVDMAASHPTMHQASGHHHATDHAVHQQVDKAQPDPASGKAAAGDCNCGCFSLCAAGDLSQARLATLERRSIGIRYVFVAHALPDAVLLIDPGIPILAM